MEDIYSPKQVAAMMEVHEKRMQEQRRKDEALLEQKRAQSAKEDETSCKKVLSTINGLIHTTIDNGGDPNVLSVTIYREGSIPCVEKTMNANGFKLRGVFLDRRLEFADNEAFFVETGTMTATFVRKGNLQS